MRRPNPELGGNGGPDGPSATQYPCAPRAIPAACTSPPAAPPPSRARPDVYTAPLLATSHSPAPEAVRASPTIGLGDATPGSARASPKCSTCPFAVASQYPCP